jgi:predicted ribosome quality control (RQC) complex YloA/Tae2 family protein
MAAEPDPAVRDIEILKLGRHFRIGSGAKVIVGRNKKENEAIQAMAHSGDGLLRCVGIPGPTALVTGGPFSTEEMETAASIVAAYSDAKEGQNAEIRLEGRGEDQVLYVAAPDKAQYRTFMI